MSAVTAGSATRGAQWLRLVGAVGIALVAIVRTAVFFAPDVVFDTDPAIDPVPFAGLGPAGSLVLDVLLLCACAAALLGEERARRGIEWRLVLLAFVPGAVILVHGSGDAGDMWRGSSWFAAILAMVAVAHLARDPALRRLLVALAAAAFVPLIVRGAANVTYEHADTIERYEAVKDEFLAEKGWAPESPSALVFERRLYERQPTAWFLTSNILGSFLACGLALWCAFGLHSLREAESRGWAGIAAVVASGAALLLVVARSKGALGAAALAIALLALGALAARPSRWRRAGSFVAIGCVLAALLAVCARGTLLPESFLDEKSLLFRWHYLSAAAAIIAAHPLAGVGPDGFKAAYLLERLPRSPEEVASAHSVFVDWFSALGGGAAAWILLVIVFLWRSGARLTAADPTSMEPPITRTRARTAAAATIVAIALTGAILVERHTLDSLAMLARCAGVIGFFACAVAAGRLLERVPARTLDVALAAAAVALVVHAQIEMTLTEPGASVLALVLLGLAAPARAVRPRGIDIASGLALLAAALAVGVAGALPAVRLERSMRDAAALVRPIGEGRLAQMRRAPADELDLRSAAASELARSSALWPASDAPVLAAAVQLERAARLAPPEARLELLDREIDVLRPLLDAGDRGRAALLAIIAHREWAQLTGDPVHSKVALDLARDMTAHDPNGLSTWRRLGDLLWEVGDVAAARDAYRRTLEIDEAWSLDPLRQLPERDREEINGRIEVSTEER